MSDVEISMKNTKAEILEALNQARVRAEAAERMRLNPEKEEKARSEKAAVESTKKAVEQNIFSKELIDKFNDLQSAIASEERRLQELYGVGREVQKLVLAIEAGRDRTAEIEAERSAKEDAMKTSIEALKAEYAQKNAELQAEYELFAKKIKVERAREAEEYQYTLSRTREKENNDWADKKALRESELKRREERTEELLREAESKAEYVQMLEAKVEGIPAMIVSERENAVAAATEALSREHNHKAALAEMDSKNAVARLADKVSFLEKELEISDKATAALQGKLDKAYSELRDLATKTVESASGVKIIGSTEKMNG